jgi:hypothetical protein
MYRVAVVFLALALCFVAPASAEDKDQSSSLTQISPIFSQLVSISVPTGFKTVFENTNGNRYIRESVLDGETADEWSQMITVTGVKGLATDPSVTAQLLATQIAFGFRHACPETFSVRRLGEAKISGQDAIVAVVGCGTVLTSITKRSETALVIVIKGSADYYTIQWAERGPPSAQSVVIDAEKWTDRLRSLSPIKVCPLVPGQVPPYPSCLNQK